MNASLVDKIANAVLYEGYMLYPYRPSIKNRQRWTFGGLYPPSYTEAHGENEPCAMQTECLVRGDAQTQVETRVRFLHLIDRIVGKLDPSSTSTKPQENEIATYHTVEALQVGDRLIRAWQEAEERDVTLGRMALEALREYPHRQTFSFPASQRFELVPEASGIIVRRQQQLSGFVELSADLVREGLFRLRVRIENETPWQATNPNCRDEALMHSLISTHTILGVHNGEFLSSIDPPEDCKTIAATCRNMGAWPVLVGEPGASDTILSSPIILYDYPEIAPESPGDLFDGTEIDEILTLRILTMTDAEKHEASAVDERTREMLNRTEALAREQLMGLHGTVRGLRPSTTERHP